MRRAGVGRQSLLRRPRRQLAGDGTILCPGQEAGRSAVGVDQGRLRSSDDPQPGGGAHRRPGGAARPGTGRTRGAGQHLAVRPVRGSAVPGLRRVLPAQWTGHRPGLRMDLGRFGRRGRLPPVGRLRRRHVPRGLRAPGGGQVGARGPLEARRVPRLGRGLPALLDRQGAADRQPDAPVHRQPAVRAVSAGPRRPDRQGRHDPLPNRSGLHRLADHRRRHADPQGFLVRLLRGIRRADPDRPGHARQERLRRREDRARHRHLDG